MKIMNLKDFVKKDFSVIYWLANCLASLMLAVIKSSRQTILIGLSVNTTCHQTRLIIN